MRRAYEAEEWKIRIDEATSAQRAKACEIWRAAEITKATKERKAPMLFEDLDDIADLKSNDRASFMRGAVGGAGMRKVAKEGACFRITASNVMSNSMQNLVIFNHDDMHDKLSKKPSGGLPFCPFRISMHREIFGIASADNSIMSCDADQSHDEAHNEI